MKLKNKKTGEIGILIVDGAYKFVTNFAIEDDKMNRLGEYNSLAELNEEWEDYEDPKECWYINAMGHANSCKDLSEEVIRDIVRIGNCFNSMHEAVLAIEKLKAWKRLKDNGLKIAGYGRYVYDPKSTHYVKIVLDYATGDEVRKDLDLLFGGEE